MIDSVEALEVTCNRKDNHLDSEYWEGLQTESEVFVLSSLEARDIGDRFLKRCNLTRGEKR